MNAIPRSIRPSRRLRRVALLLAALAMPAFADNAAGNDPHDTTSTDRITMHDQPLLDIANITPEGTEDERASLQSLGFDPDDPIALQAYRAEVALSPTQALATNNFVLDRGWGSEGRTPERYDDTSFGIYRGIKATKLDTGEVVAVGAVQVDWQFSLGITKRNAAGQRVSWTNALSTWSSANGQYLLVSSPPTGSSRRITEVRDIKAKGNRFYVLANVTYASTSRILPEIFCFNADGSLCDDVPFSFSNGGNVRGLAIDVSSDHLVLLTTNTANIDADGFSTRYWTVESNGALVNPTSGYFPSPGGYARTAPVDIAFRSGAGNGGGYYVLYTRKYSADSSSQDFDPCLLSVNANHTPDTGFAAGGTRCKPFDQSGSSLNDRAVALRVGTYLVVSGGTVRSLEQVHVLVDVARSIKSGFGIWALRQQSDDIAFGTNGQRTFGGCASTEPCASPIGIPYMDKPMDFDYLGSELAIVGYRSSSNIIGYSPLLARVSVSNGSLLQLEGFASGYGDGQFNSLAVRDGKHLVGIGEAIDNSVGNAAARTQIMIGLTNDDSIFKNGFD